MRPCFLDTHSLLHWIFWTHNSQLTCWFLWREENRRKTLVAQERTTHQTNSTHIQSYPSQGSNWDRSVERWADKPLCTHATQNQHHPKQRNSIIIKEWRMYIHTCGADEWDSCKLRAMAFSRSSSLSSFSLVKSITSSVNQVLLTS